MRPAIRSENTGSMSTEAPSTCTRKLAWPSQVIRGRDAGVASRARSGATRATSACAGERRRRPARRSSTAQRSTADGGWGPLPSTFTKRPRRSRGAEGMGRTYRTEIAAPAIIVRWRLERPMSRISRRSFLAVAGALALRARGAGAPAVPEVFDHMLLGCGDLDKGIEFVERHLGVGAAFGGVHPGRGSRNALLSLGQRRYLEVIAPDPEQPRSADVRQLHRIESPRLIGWAAHVDDRDAVVQRLRGSGIAFEPVRPGSRQRPSGETLRRKALSLRDDNGGLLPF